MAKREKREAKYERVRVSWVLNSDMESYGTGVQGDEALFTFGDNLSLELRAASGQNKVINRSMPICCELNPRSR